MHANFTFFNLPAKLKLYSPYSFHIDSQYSVSLKFLLSDVNMATTAFVQSLCININLCTHLWVCVVCVCVFLDFDLFHSLYFTCASFKQYKGEYRF